MKLLASTPFFTLPTGQNRKQPTQKTSEIVIKDTIHFEGAIKGKGRKGELQKTERISKKVIDAETGKYIRTADTKALTNAQKTARSRKADERRAEFLSEPEHLTRPPVLPNKEKSKWTIHDKSQIVRDNRDFVKKEFKDDYKRINGDPTPEHTPEPTTPLQQSSSQPQFTDQQYQFSQQPQQNPFTLPDAMFWQPEPEVVTGYVPSNVYPDFFHRVFNTGRVSPIPRQFQY